MIQSYLLKLKIKNWGFYFLSNFFISFFFGFIFNIVHESIGSRWGLEIRKTKAGPLTNSLRNTNQMYARVDCETGV